MQDQNKSKAELKAELESVKAENERLRTKLEEDENQDANGISRRKVLARGAGIAAAGAMGIYASTGSVAADPQGTIPVSTSDPFLKIRADRTHYYTRTSEPATPPSGVVAVYTQDGDL